MNKLLYLIVILSASLCVSLGCGRLRDAPSAAASTQPEASTKPLDAGAPDARIGCYYVDYNGKGKARFCPLYPPAPLSEARCVGIDGCNWATCELRDGVPTLHSPGSLECLPFDMRDE